MKKSIIVLPLVMMTIAGNSYADQVILDDLITVGSHCVGMDCFNGESFGFDTIRLKENNLRIKFQDTSNSASFPTNDWQITANESSNGGLNKFSIDDISGGRTPFTIEAGAPSHSLYVEDGGRVGFGTNTPVVDLHAKTGNTPTLRLDQDGSSGFTPQTWDVAGNEANFFIRDATNGSTLPFSIRPGAPSRALDIWSDKITIHDSMDVGVGTTSPTAPLHVSRGDGTTHLLVEETGSLASRIMQRLKNNGPTSLYFEDSSASGGTWSFTLNNNNFLINNVAGTGLKIVAGADNSYRVQNKGTGVETMKVAADGNMVIAGQLTTGSSRSIKDNIDTVEHTNILSKLDELTVSYWNYKTTNANDRHIGPMAEDFYDTFGLGSSDKHIAPGDMAGIALAAAKALNEKSATKDDQIKRLSKENEDLKLRMQAMEAKMADMIKMMSVKEASLDTIAVAQ